MHLLFSIQRIEINKYCMNNHFIFTVKFQPVFWSLMNFFKFKMWHLTAKFQRNLNFLKVYRHETTHTFRLMNINRWNVNKTSILELWTRYWCWSHINVDFNTTLWGILPFHRFRHVLHYLTHDIIIFTDHGTRIYKTDNWLLCFQTIFVIISKFMKPSLLGSTSLVKLTY